MKRFSTTLVFSLVISLSCQASEGCGYYIDHQMERFVYSVESEPTGEVEIEYFFKDEPGTYKFRGEFKREGTVDDSDFYEVGKKVKLVHRLKLPRFALEAWFYTHYHKVCAYEGHIDNWITKSESQP